MKAYLIYSFTFLIVIANIQSSSGQRSRKLNPPDHRFELVLITGFNVSQMDGDYFTGFDKTGLNTGIQVDALLNAQMRITVGMQYSQKGAQIPHGVILTPQSRNDRIIKLNYIEVPILFKSMLKKQDHGPFVEVGTSFARLSSTKITERDPAIIRGTIYKDIESFFNKADINLVAGIGFTLGNRFNFTFRYNYGLSKFYTNPDFELPSALSGQAKEVEFLRNYNIAILVSYRLI